MDRSSPAERLLESPRYQFAGFVSPDGDVLLSREQFEETNWDILSVRLDEEPEPTVLMRTQRNDSSRLSGPRRVFQDGRLLMVTVMTEPEFAAGPPRVAFETDFWADSGAYPAPCDIAPDGERFLSCRITREPVASLNVTLNWFQELTRRVAEGQ